MNNFEMDAKAQDLADGTSAYSLARRVLELEADRDALAADRDELSRDWDSEHYHRLAVERREQALAAHVERLILGGRALHHELQQWSLTERDPETSAVMSVWDAIVGITPTTSLAQRDARMKAEALEKLCQGTSHYREANPVRGLAASMADECRQQSEGDA